MRKSKTGELRQDDSSHWYLVPDDRLKDFDAAMEQIEGQEYMDAPDAFDAFISEFDDYRIDGGPYNLKVLMPSS